MFTIYRRHTAQSVNEQLACFTWIRNSSEYHIFQFFFVIVYFDLAHEALLWVLWSVYTRARVCVRVYITNSDILQYRVTIYWRCTAQSVNEHVACFTHIRTSSEYHILHVFDNYIYILPSLRSLAMSVIVCVYACVRACVRVCVRMCVCVCVRIIYVISLQRYC